MFTILPLWTGKLFLWPELRLHIVHEEASLLWHLCSLLAFGCNFYPKINIFIVIYHGYSVGLGIYKKKIGLIFTPSHLLSTTLKGNIMSLAYKIQKQDYTSSETLAQCKTRTALSIRWIL